MKYIYDKELNFINSFFDEVKNEDIINFYGLCYIVDKKFTYPILDNKKIREMDEDEISSFKYRQYVLGNYTLEGNEIIEDEKVKSYTCQQYEYIENGIIKFNYEEKREFLLSESKRLEEIEKEKSFEFKGLIQPNRELEDQTSLLKIISLMNITKQTKFDNWKMKDANGNEHYVSLTIQELLQLAGLMQEQTTQAMIKYSKIREDIKNLSDEELKKYELKGETDETVIHTI